MKNSFNMLLALTFICSIAIGQKNVKTKINNITLYLDGAKINRQANVNITKGEQKIIISNLSEKIENSTVRINTSKKVKILSVTTRNNYLNSKTKKSNLNSIKDSIQYLERKNLEIVDQLNALQSEKNILLTNQKMNGTADFSVEKLKQLSLFIGKRTLEINKKTTKLNLRQGENEFAIISLNNHLKYNQKVKTKSFKEIVIVLKSNSTQSVAFDIEYIVNSAGWVPSYDIRVADLAKPITLNYKAQVYNNTGVDWQKAKFYLSTSDPRKDATQPTLDAWVINNNGYNKDYSSISNTNYDSKNEIIKDGIVYEEIEIPALSMEFKITDRYNIPSDAKPYLVDVTSYSLNATYKHFAVPKVEKSVFLLARISGWEQLNLIEGNANIYFGTSYVGKSYIKTSTVNDTLDISLGRDNKVSIDRIKTKDYTDNKVIGKSKKDILAFELKVKNLRKVPVEIEILDQVPISGDDDIEIVVLKKGGANFNNKSGMLKWNLSLESMDSKQLDLAFSIKYPRQMSFSKYNSIRKIKAKF